MLFTVCPLKFPDTDRALAVDQTLGTTGRDGPAATADIIREVENGRGFLLSGVQGCGKTSLLNQVCFHFNWQIHNVVALGPLSLGLVAQNGLDSLGSQLRDWFRDNETRLPSPLSSTPQPTQADSLDAWLPFLNQLISQRNAETLVLLLDDLDSVPLENRETVLHDIQNSSWAKIATRTVLGCAVSLPEDQTSSVHRDYSLEGDRPVSSVVAAIMKRETVVDLVNALIESCDTLGTETESTAVILKRETMLDLVNALIGSLGAVPESMKMGGKGGKGKGGGLYGGVDEAFDESDEVGLDGELGRGPDASGTGETITEPEIVEDVDATVYAPVQASPADNFLVLVYAHLPTQAAAVEEEAKAVAPDVKKRFGRTLDKQIKRGTKLTFNLTMPGLEIDEPSQSLIWRGEHESVQFNVTVPKDSGPRSIVGTVIVSESSVPIGHLKFTFKVVTDSAAVASTTQPVQAGSLIRYQRAFISYASPDRAEVLKRVQMLNASKVNFFQDLLTLEPGDRWEKLIYQYIDQSDVFFVFWSKAASKSPWVKKEIAYAIERKAGKDEAAPEIVPVIIEGPPPAKPPKELGFLHFNDKFMYFIKGEEDRG